MKRILLKQETLDKIQALKKLFNITKDTTYIDQLVDKFYEFYIVPRNVTKWNPFWVSTADLINKDRFDLKDNK